MHLRMIEPETKPTVAPNYERWTLSKMVDFLVELHATHSVTAAAKAVGMSRNSAYRLRARRRGQGFDAAWAAAFKDAWPWRDSGQAGTGS